MKFTQKLACYFLLIFIFSLLYYSLDDDDIFIHNKAKGVSFDDNTFLATLYFSITTQSTLGYSDALPHSTRAKVLVSIHSLVTTSILLA